MSTDLKTQLDRYFSQVEAVDTPIDAQEVADRLDSVRPLPVLEQPVRRSWRKPVLVTLGAALAVFVLLAIPLLLRPSTEGQTPATTPAPTVTTPVTTPVVQSMAPPDLTWEEVTFALGIGPQHGFISAGSDGFIVLQPGFEGSDSETGAPTDPDGDPRTILWLSDDGQTWESHVLERFESERPWLVGEAHGTYVLSAWDAEGRLTYLSTDLETWSPWEVESDDGTRVRFAVTGLAATGDAVVGDTGRSLVRANADFTSGQVIEDPFGTDGDRSILNVVATANHFYALVYSNETGRSEVWSSVNGVEWTPALIDLPRSAEQIEARIVANNDRVLVFIEGGGSEGPFWIAESGDPFESVEGLPRLGEVTLAATDDGFIVTFVASFGTRDAITSSGTYTTSDGSEWAQVMPPGTSVASWSTSGSYIFASTGQWVVERNEDGDVASEFFEQGGSWIVGTTGS